MEVKKRPTHRWTEQETYQLLLEVSKDLQKRAAAFEKPTSERFYTKIACRNNYLKHISWTVMKAKMRHLRLLFIAENGKAKQTSPEERQMDGLMGKKCPHFDLLKLIFGQKEYMQPNCIQSEIHADFDAFSDSKDDDIEGFSDHIESETSKTGKKTRLRHNETHFWSEEETAVLIKYVLEGIDNDPKKFEKPCSRLFYETNCKKGILEKIEWSLMKSKMRYFRVLYLKAEKWLEDVGTELFESDGKHITTRLNSICPYYNELKPIFESRLPVDPIKISWNAIGGTMPVPDEQTKEADGSVENIKRLLKIESVMDVDDSLMHSDVASISENSEGDNDANDDAYSTLNILTPKIEHDLPNADTTHFRKTALELQQEKLKFEKHKFAIECEHHKKQDELQRLHLEIEKEKLEFEKQKLRSQEDLKRHEIDQNFMLKKLQLEKEERMQRFEMEKNERLRQIEMEYKYKIQTNKELT